MIFFRFWNCIESLLTPYVSFYRRLYLRIEILYPYSIISTEHISRFNFIVPSKIHQQIKPNRQKKKKRIGFHCQSIINMIDYRFVSKIIVEWFFKLRLGPIDMYMRRVELYQTKEPVQRCRCLRTCEWSLAPGWHNENDKRVFQLSRLIDLFGCWIFHPLCGNQQIWNIVVKLSVACVAWCECIFVLGFKFTCGLCNYTIEIKWEWDRFLISFFFFLLNLLQLLHTFENSIDKPKKIVFAKILSAMTL